MCLAALGVALCVAAPAAADTDLSDLSLEDLMDIEVTSVSKRSEALADSAAAVTVISNEDIRRSGANSIPDLLRQVPGLHVAQINASNWQITARGFNDQFANKLLVMIDGRSVYTPLFSGVFWDVQDVVLEDVDRIEVVRGPGGTLWGANAVNGVINIITKPAQETEGLLTSVVAGNQDRVISVGRYGGAIGERFHYRGYLKYLDRERFDNADGIRAHDAWENLRGGFRFDANPTDADRLTLQGDYYGGDYDSTGSGPAPVPGSNEVFGANLLARWTRSFSEGSELRVQAYYDRTDRDTPLLDEDRNLFDVEVEHQILLAGLHDVVWGVGYRYMDDENLSGAQSPVAFEPGRRQDNLFSGFVQDRITLFSDRLQLTVGSKFEHNDYTGFEYQPSARALFRPDEKQRVWAAVSRAVRTPSRADHDVGIVAPTGPGQFAALSGDRSFDSEELLSFELGYRIQPIQRLSFDLAGYYNMYDHLRSSLIGAPLLGFPGPTDVTLPVSVANGIEADAWGAELATRFRAHERWTLFLNYTYMKVDVDDDDGVAFSVVDPHEKSTPEHQVQLLSRLDLPFDFELDGSLFWVDEILGGAVGDYFRLDTRLGWRPYEGLDVAFVGQNLIEASHLESTNGLLSQRSEVPRSYYGKVTWRFF